MHLEKAIYLLNHYGYWVGYSAYHAPSELEKYRARPDAVDPQPYLTVYTKEGYVVGRVHNLPPQAAFASPHAKQLISYFQLFELPFRQEVIRSLKKLFPE